MSAAQPHATTTHGSSLSSVTSGAFDFIPPDSENTVSLTGERGKEATRALRSTGNVCPQGNATAHAAHSPCGDVPSPSKRLLFIIYHHNGDFDFIFLELYSLISSFQPLLFSVDECGSQVPTNVL